MAESAESNQETSTTNFQRSLNQKYEEALTECDRSIQRFKYIADKDKRRFTLLKKFSISLTLVVTLLSALAASKRLGDRGWIVPAVSGLAALSTTLLSQTTSQKTWINSRDVQQRLQVEKFLYLQTSGNYPQMSEEEKVCHFSNQVMEIWSEGHETWGQAVSDKKK